MANLTDIAKGTMIGFTANKTEAEAKANATGINNRMVICKTKQLYMNGERVGLTDNEAEYIKNKIKAELQAKADAKFTVTLTATPNPYEKNGVNSVGIKGVSVIFTATLKYNGQNVQNRQLGGTPSDTIEITNNTTNKLTLTWNTSSKTYTLSTKVPIVGTWTIKAQTAATDENITTSIKNASVAVSAYDYIYFGATTNDKIDNKTITGFIDGANGSMNAGAGGSDILFKALSSLKSSAAGSYTFDIPENGYAYILIPQGVAKGTFATADGEGNYHASEGVSDVIFVKQENLVTSNLTSSVETSTPINNLVAKGITFEVFRLSSAQSKGTHTFKI